MNILRSAIAFGVITTQSHSAITTKSFGAGTSDPHFIEILNTTIGENADLTPNLALSSSSEDLKFVRHIETSDICYYWFRATGDPTQYTNTETWSDVYWFVNSSCSYVDGAQFGSDNYVLLRSTSQDAIVAVLQYEFANVEGGTDHQHGKLIAYAVDPEGMTFSQGVSAIQAIPEPTSALLGFLGLSTLLLRRRR